MSRRKATLVFVAVVATVIFQTTFLGADLENIATVGISNGFGDTSQNVVTFVDVETDLALSLSVLPGLDSESTTATLVLRVENLGPSNSTGAAVHATIPAGTTFDSSPDGCFENSGEVRCNLGPIDTGTSVEVSAVLNFPVETAGPLVSDGLVDSNELDPNSDNDTDSAVIERGLFYDGFEDGTTDAWSLVVSGR